MWALAVDSQLCLLLPLFTIDLFSLLLCLHCCSSALCMLGHVNGHKIPACWLSGCCSKSMVDDSMTVLKFLPSSVSLQIFKEVLVWPHPYLSPADFWKGPGGSKRAWISWMAPWVLGSKEVQECLTLPDWGNLGGPASIRFSACIQRDPGRFTFLHC